MHPCLNTRCQPEAPIEKKVKHTCSFSIGSHQFTQLCRHFDLEERFSSFGINDFELDDQRHFSANTRNRRTQTYIDMLALWFSLFAVGYMTVSQSRPLDSVKRLYVRRVLFRIRHDYCQGLYVLNVVRRFQGNLNLQKQTNNINHICQLWGLICAYSKVLKRAGIQESYKINLSLPILWPWIFLLFATQHSD